MQNIEAAVTDILYAFDTSAYPSGFLENYDQLECLAGGHGTETFLVRGKRDEQLYVAKCYDKSIYSRVCESSILKSVHHDGLPAYVEEFQSDTMICILRGYVTGTPLNQYAADYGPTAKEIVKICVQLCDILIYLHGQECPIIHRDIKPQNIIVKADGAISLIDFDISRIYQAGAKTDTQFLGTREFAPPEQYGFSQTDCRADIYSLGVVLGWLLTGLTDPKEAIDRFDHKGLSRIYKKCTAFSPESRYASAEKLKAALLQADGRKKSSVVCYTAAALLCLGFLCAGFSIGRYTDFLAAILQPHEGVVFAEPMLEQAVRLQLGKPAKEAITEEELLSVTGLYVFGASLIAKNEEELLMEANRLFEKGQMTEGPIHSLADLSNMPNLKRIFISMQQITDITPLEDLPNLEIVELKNNPIADISPLGKLKFLKRVSLFDTRITDLSPLANCPMLTVLEAGKLPVSSFSIFDGLGTLESLSLYETKIETLSGIESLTRLRFFEVAEVLDGDLTPLLSLAHLEGLVLDESMQKAAEAIEGQAGFTIAYR